MADTVGSLSSIARYPIKSFQGESITSCVLQEQGIFADRPLALLDKASGKVLSGKHARLGERILGFSACYVSEPLLGKALPEIRVTIDGEYYSSNDIPGLSRRCSEVLDTEVEIIHAGGAPVDYESYWPEVEDLPLAGATMDFALPLAEAGSFADLEPLHLLTTASLAHLATLAPDSEIDVARFRPGLLIDSDGSAGFLENEWVGRTANLGDAELEFSALAPRCIMTTRVQKGLPKDPTILKTLVQNNRHDYMGFSMPCLGIYATVRRPGTVSVGDQLRLH
jgi:uncharacterized protein YcbX